RSPAERGGESPADKRLRVVHGNEIGAGHGLDEAELARRDPLDGSSDEER
ncbi:phosphotransferase system, HPr-related protein, partial [Pseudomonas aeruginosa]|nr:phosphotransferase system, HPr-related protein [Pseudomonas aeruginosa]MCR1760711.1 phosphotransferase system, HPr-related protein [Pseudomonas aeruginosa]